MGSVFSKPKAPKMPPVIKAPPPPTADNKDAQMQVRSAQRARSERKGMRSTLLAGKKDKSGNAESAAGTSNLLG